MHGRRVLAAAVLATVTLGGVTATAVGVAGSAGAAVRPHAASAATSTVITGASDGTNGYIFWKGADGNLWYSANANGAGTWTAPTAALHSGVGMGPLGSAPTATYVASTTSMDVFWQGADGNLWYTIGTISAGPVLTWTAPQAA